jgi:hypothetical protein
MITRSHGDAERLIVEDANQNVERFDVRGEAVEDARTSLVNKFAGPGRFKKMFDDLEPFRPADEGLVELGLAMRENLPEDPALNNSAIPAGFTYLGQFIDHDVTFDQTEGFPQIDDPELIEQARTPNLDLDSVYGLGPQLQKELYDQGVPKGRAIFKIGRTDAAPSPGNVGTPPIPGSLPHDLPRRPDKIAVIADPRNDENLVIAQTHVAFLKFHNRVMTMLPTLGPSGTGESRFERTRRLVTWHYQWIVLNDFVARIVDPKVLNDIRKKGRKFYKAGKSEKPYMPLEFSVAAYRLGHSMVRETYNYNRVFSQDPGALTVATLALLFTFTGRGGFFGAATLPSNWIIDWRRFFEVGPKELLNFTRKIDPRLIPQLHDLPNMPEGEPKSLAVRNLLRGSRVGLPTGQDVAARIGVTALTPAEVAGGEEGPVVKKHGFDTQTPLWYYILREAAVQGNAQHLGAVGSRIVGEFFVGILEADKRSYVSQRPNWKPILPSKKGGHFTMADLLRIVNEINPIG